MPDRKLFMVVTYILFFMSISLFPPVLCQSLPDLTAKIKCPGSAAAGENLGTSIVIELINLSDSPAKNIGVDIVLSKDANIPLKTAAYSSIWFEDVLLKGGREFVESINGNASLIVQLKGMNMIPEDTPTGDYYIGVFVDSTDSNKEINERNNAAVCPIKIKGKDLVQIETPHLPQIEKAPDLAIGRIFVTPDPVFEGNKADLHCEFKNIGGDLKGAWKISYLVDGAEVYFQNWSNIPSGGFRNPSGVWTATGPGLHRFACILDAGNTIGENSEANNKALTEFLVKATAKQITSILIKNAAIKLPDLVMVKTYVQPLRSVSGEKLELHCDFKNINADLTGNWKLSYYIDGTEVYSQNWGDLPAGVFRNPFAIVNANKPGKHIFTCKLDSEGIIAEVSEDNNKGDAPFSTGARRPK